MPRPYAWKKMNPSGFQAVVKLLKRPASLRQGLLALRRRTGDALRPGGGAPFPRLSQRFPLDPRLRRGAVLALALLALLPGYFTLRAFLTPATQVVQAPAWGWAHWGGWDYTILLKPNTVYGTQELGPGLTYFDALVEGMEARFSYTFTTDTPARIEGWYEVFADLAVGELPAQRFLLVARTPFQQGVDGTAVYQGAASSAPTALPGQGAAARIAVALPVDRKAYQRRVEQLLAEAGVRARPDSSGTITYTARVEATAATGTGSTTQTLEPSLTVPLGGETFTVAGAPALNKSGTVRLPQEQPVPGVKARRYTLPLATLAAVLLPLGFLRATTAAIPNQEDPLARQARRLRRRYAKRIAQAAPGHSPLPGAEAVSVAGMADLVRVSEELLKPIVYAAPAPPGGSHLFYVLDGATRYEFRLEAS
jgi:hypothetical protein